MNLCLNCNCLWLPNKFLKSSLKVFAWVKTFLYIFILQIALYRRIICLTVEKYCKIHTFYIKRNLLQMKYKTLNIWKKNNNNLVLIATNLQLIGRSFTRPCANLTWVRITSNMLNNNHMFQFMPLVIALFYSFICYFFQFNYFCPPETSICNNLLNQ